MEVPATSARQAAASAEPGRIAGAYTPARSPRATLDTVRGRGAQCGDVAPSPHVRGVRVMPATLPALLDALTERHAEREALISARGRLRFRELADLADRVARTLAARGVAPGTRVGLLLPNWPEWIAIAFGVWRCGGVLVPISTLYRPRELGHALEHAEVSLLITVRGFLSHDYSASLEALSPGIARGAPPRFGSLRTVVLLEPSMPLALGPLLDGPPGQPGPGPAADHPATILFTSASTADPP